MQTCQVSQPQTGDSLGRPSLGHEKSRAWQEKGAESDEEDVEKGRLHGSRWSALGSAQPENNTSKAFGDARWPMPLNHFQVPTIALALVVPCGGPEIHERRTNRIVPETIWNNWMGPAMFVCVCVCLCLRVFVLNIVCLWVCVSWAPTPCQLTKQLSRSPQEASSCPLQRQVCLLFPCDLGPQQKVALC